MTDKKEIQMEDLDQVTGGRQYGAMNINNVTFKYGVGAHIELIHAIGIFSGHEYTYSSHITERGICKETHGINVFHDEYFACYYVKTDDPDHDSDSGWYKEDLFNNDYKVNPLQTGL